MLSSWAGEHEDLAALPETDGSRAQILICHLDSATRPPKTKGGNVTWAVGELSSGGISLPATVRPAQLNVGIEADIVWLALDY